MYGLVVKVTHISGKQMIAQQGVDGVSCGSTTEVVMGGAEMSSFIPLHLSALEQADPLCNRLLT